MISVPQALALILKSIRPLAAVRLPLADCLKRVLSEDISASVDIPPFSNSAMDGWAVRSRDAQRASARRPVLLAITGDLPAGASPRRPVRPGETIRIMTGAAIPPGADAVVRSEDSREVRSRVKILVPAAPGLNIRRAGESVRRGETVLRRGQILRPPEIGLLASLGIPTVKAIPAPRVAVISTGNELRPLGGKLTPGKIFDCNRYSLTALVAEYGGIPVPFGIVGDREAAIRTAFRRARGCDLVLTSGGVSVGEHDLVKKVLTDSGGKIDVWRIAMKPGKPLTFGSLSGRPFFGLPGNPVSAIVSFLLFVRPALLAMQGKAGVNLREERAVLEEDFGEISDRTQFVRAVLVRRRGRLYARPTGPQGSGIPLSLVLADGLIVIPPRRRLKKGARVRALRLD